MVSQMMLADGIFIAAKRLATMSGFAMSEAEGITAEQLDDSFQKLHDAVEAAIDADRKASWVLIQELQALFSKGPFGYWPDRQEFEKSGEKWFELFRAQRSAIQTLIKDVQEAAGPVPAQLEADSLSWAAAAATVDTVRAGINVVRQIPGWGGGASYGYAQRSTVQDAASTELHGMAKSMSNALNQIALFNRALFLFMDREIIKATSAVQALKQGPDGYHFARSANGTSLLRELHRILDAAAAGQPVAAASANLQQLVSECLASPQLLEAGSWPTGGGQAGIPPAATDGVPDPDADVGPRVEAPAPTSRPRDAEGVQRNP